MRIVIDGQALQAAGLPEAGFGSLGALLAALATGLEQHDLFLILDGARPEHIASIRAMVEGLVTVPNIRLWYAPAPAADASAVDDWRARTAMLVREGLLASLDADLVIALFDLDTAAECVFSIGLLHAIPTIACIERSPSSRLAPGSAAARLLAKMAHAGRILVTGDPHDEVSAAIALQLPRATMVGSETGAMAVAVFAAVAAVTPDLPAAIAKPRLAYVSPLPPERSGISFYSAELLAALSRHYDIELIVNQHRVPQADWNAGLPVRDVRWFSQNAGRYEHIIYHFGNSNFHRHMFAMLEAHPGVVVLHDFFLSGVVVDMDTSGYAAGAWVRELYSAHGYRAASERFLEKEPIEVVWRYPCSGSVLANATGVIAHAQSTKALARRWHGADAERRLTVIPHLRAPRAQTGRQEARKTLGLADGDFVVCAFGGLGPTKLNHRLVDAWLASRLADDPRCTLIFVGLNDGGRYGRALSETIKAAKGKRIRITGWEDEQRFQLYLAAADVAVQLRALSRGETSGTVLDCMNGGVPLIINAHGSMADLPADTAWMLDDSFEDQALVEAIETLERDAAMRAAIARRARQHVERNHNPAEVASRYVTALEAFAARPRSHLARLGPALGTVLHGQSDAAADAVAAGLALTIQPPFAMRQILIDVSAIVRNDLRTGIERAVRALIRELIASPPEGFRIEPVFARATGFFYARRFTADLLGIRTPKLEDEPIELRAGDVYFMPDLEHESVIRNRATYQAMRNHGVSVNFMVHDLLPVRLPAFFPSQAATMHHKWLSVVSEADQVICVSRAVADDFAEWRAQNAGEAGRALVAVSHHGADIRASHPTIGMPRDGERMLAEIAASPTFLMVGTVEPRKGHAEVLEAFERLWATGGEEKLVIVGKAGWMLGDLLSRLKRHRERGRHLFWIDNASDEYLGKIYAACACLIAASHGEGFGLPLIEAAAHGLPMIARDIPVFREVAGDHAFYFDARTADGLADAIRQWRRLARDGMAPDSRAMPKLTWAQSAETLKGLLVGGGTA